MRVELHRAIGWQAFLHKRAEGFADLHRVLLVHQTERDLGRGLCGDHRLEAFAGIAAGDAVYFRCRARPGKFQNAAALFAGRDGKADRAEEVFRRATEAFPGLQDLRRGFFDAFIEARNRDPSGFVVKIGQNLAQNVDRIGSRTAEKARMQIAVGSLDDDFFANQTAQSDADGRRFRVPHGGVADQRHIGFQFRLVGIEEGF